LSKVFSRLKSGAGAENLRMMRCVSAGRTAFPIMDNDLSFSELSIFALDLAYVLHYNCYKNLVTTKA